MIIIVNIIMNIIIIVVNININITIIIIISIIIIMIIQDHLHPKVSSICLLGRVISEVS